MTAVCIKDWPSHFIKAGDTCKFERYIDDSYVVKFPKLEWIAIGERKFKRYFSV